MHEPYIQLQKGEVQVVFDINSTDASPLSRVFAPQYSVNITPPQFCQNENRVGIEIFKAVSPSLSFSVFKREMYVPELEALDVMRARVILGEKTIVEFPRK